MRSFFLKKGVNLSVKTYGVTALSYMALGLFASLIIGLIIQTIGQQFGIAFFENMGALAISLMGPAIGAAVAYGLQAPPLVVFSAVATGAAGAELGGPAGAFIAALVSVELGKLVSKETRLDIIVTPLVTIIAGYGTAQLLGPGIQAFMTGFGDLIVWATERQPLIMGILVAGLMGLALTAPISSAAIAIILDLNGIAAGAATVGCAAQMVGFAASSFRENKFSGLAALGIGTSMLQVPNVVRRPLILVPPTLAGMIVAPFSTMVFMMENNAAGAGMGTSGLVGQIMTFQTMGFSFEVLGAVMLLHVVAPALISLGLSEWMRKRNWIRMGDMKIPEG